MSIGTNRLFQTNQQLFSTLNKELRALQEQAGSGTRDLKLSDDLTDISKLSALEETSSELNQYISNAERVKTDLAVQDLAFERLQDLSVRLQEVSVSSMNDVLLPEGRERFVIEAKMIKDEFLDVANQKDSLGNLLFSGIAQKESAFVTDKKGAVQYQGSGIAKETRISSGLSVQNNFAGSEVFQNIDGLSGKFSVFELIDNMITSLENPTNSFQFETSLENDNFEILTLPETGQKAEISFSVNVKGTSKTISSTVYSNDYSSLVQKLNQNFVAMGLQAELSNHNQITLSGSVDSVKISGYEFKGEGGDDHPILFGAGSLGSDVRMLLQEKHGFSPISENITNLFEHFSSKRAEVSQSFRRTEETYTNNQDLLISLEEDMSSTRDADMAKILTQIEFLMTKKEAAQATFTRISAKSLFDYLG